LSNKLDSTFYRKNQDGNLTFRPEALSEILPMLKTEKSIESGGRVTKWWVNENLNIMGRMLSSQSELIAAGKWKPLYGSLKSLKLELEDTEGSAVVKKELIESQLEPLIAGYEGHSYDLYKNQWDSAIKHFDKSDKTGFFKGLPLLGKENNGFDDVKDAMDSLYLHIQNKYGDIIGTAKAVFSGDETNSKRLMSDVFPKIQIAYKALHPNEPLLAPMDFVSMMLNDYKADTNKTATVLGKTVINPGVVLDWGDTSSKRWYNSELYKVLLKTSQIKYD
jgi:hypothetical protein